MIRTTSQITFCLIFSLLIGISSGKGGKRGLLRTQRVLEEDWNMTFDDDMFNITGDDDEFMEILANITGDDDELLEVLANITADDFDDDDELDDDDE